MAPNPDRQPKRIILRLRVNDTECWSPSDLDGAIGAYLTFAGVPASSQEHTTHFEPLQDASLQQTHFHIILDMFKDSITSPNINTLPHELYPVRRDLDGQFQVSRLDTTHETNMLRKIRPYTTDFYAWGV